MVNSELRQQIEKFFCLAQNGDSEAYGKIFDLLADDIYRFVFFKIGQRMDAQDITSETFKRAWIRLKSLKKDNFRAYLYQIARNLTIDYFRHQKRHLSFEKRKEAVDKKSDTEKLLLKKQKIACLYNALKKLSAKYEEVIICRFIEELSVKETAKTMGISQISVRVIQYRAIRQLRKILK